MSQRKIALFDIDKTLFDGYIIFPLAQNQQQEGLLNKHSADSLNRDRELYKNAKTTYESFAEDVIVHWARGLKGQSYKKILQHTKLFLKQQESSFFHLSIQFLSF